MCYLDTSLGLCLEVHVGDHVGEAQASDGEPSPRLHPPGCKDEKDGRFYAPAFAGIWNNYHCHIYCEALCSSSSTLVYRALSQIDGGVLTFAGR